jgi:hypothetical protein
VALLGLPVRTEAPAVSDARVTLTDLLDNPELGLDVPAREAAAMLATLAAAVEVLRVAAARGEGNGASNGADGDTFLTAAEVGARLGLTERQVYRRQALRAFAVPGLGVGTLRFSARGLEHYIAWCKGGGLTDSQ